MPRYQAQFTNPLGPSYGAFVVEAASIGAAVAFVEKTVPVERRNDWWSVTIIDEKTGRPVIVQPCQ